MKTSRNIYPANIWQDPQTGLYLSVKTKHTHTGFSETVEWVKRPFEAYTGGALPLFCRRDPKVMGTKCLPVSVELIVRVLE